MKEYVEETIKEADAALMTKQRDQANTPAKATLFEINAETPPLNKADADHYHILTFCPFSQLDRYFIVCIMCVFIREVCVCVHILVKIHILFVYVL